LGIIKFLTDKCGGNVHDKGLVTVIADRPFNKEIGNAPKNIADLEKHTDFFSANQPNMWIGYEFRKGKIKPSAYSIRPHHAWKPGGHNLKSWVIEVSDDSENWRVIDTRTNDATLNSGKEAKVFELNEYVQCRAIRIRQTAENHKGAHTILISAFEVFGDLIGYDM
jgi:hypothetical protein